MKAPPTFDLPLFRACARAGSDLPGASRWNQVLRTFRAYPPLP
ncbi:Hypothetical Protein RRSL_03531 [Ralstonia solanacearum UW551]|uniref:Uncharacterized protein n=1 Tax=Ralstonia solanacearum (strain UW551) TaxID=342110 RepID=A0AB33VIA8_RALSU|nr:Hypothetical Protein RRSL_03531 [Ralstonia solanacearum UW551]